MASPAAELAIAEQHLGLLVFLAALDALPPAADHAEPVALRRLVQGRPAAVQVAGAPAVLPGAGRELAHLAGAAAEHAELDLGGAPGLADLAEPLASGHLLQLWPAALQVASPSAGRPVAEEELVRLVLPAAAQAPQVAVVHEGLVPRLGPQVLPRNGKLPREGVVAGHHKVQNIADGNGVGVDKVCPVATQVLWPSGWPRTRHPQWKAVDVRIGSAGDKEDLSGGREVVGLKPWDTNEQQTGPVYPLRELRPIW
mmetsp:Transcript_103288/g.301360  ORF Transcript_103288/g.301360 Transcript_103288/m.301360 type:complete len:255 (-) Transcript_103288:639-1403(-)